MNLIRIALIAGAMVWAVTVYGDNNFPYTKTCESFGLKQPNSPSLNSDAALGIAQRKPYESKGMKLHEQGKWKDSNCFLIHALNISMDHSMNLINTVGFNFAVLGNDSEALRYFEDATGFTFDLDNWLRHKSKPPFSNVLNKPIYKKHEQVLYEYYKQMGIPVPKY